MAFEKIQFLRIHLALSSPVIFIFSKNLKQRLNQIPVYRLFLISIVLYLNIILKIMSNSQFRKNIWQSLVRLALQSPIDWTSLEPNFQIKKLQLEKLQPKEILQRKSEFEKKYQESHRISKSWMENQYRLFIWFLFMYSKYLFQEPDLFSLMQWNIVSQCFGKHPLFCQYFYLSSKKKKSSQWTTEEDLTVQKFMRGQLKKKWTQIGLQLFIRSSGMYFKKPKAIRERWLSHLDPKIKKQDWDLSQDYQLIKNIKEKGKKWSKIARLIGNRTQHSIKNRYNQLVSKYMKDHRLEKLSCQSDDTRKIIEQLYTSFEKGMRKRQLAINQPVKPQIHSSVSIQTPYLVKCQEDQLISPSIKLFCPIILSNNNFQSTFQQDANQEMVLRNTHQKKKIHKICKKI